jgi:hypothetical protein
LAGAVIGAFWWGLGGALAGAAVGLRRGCGEAWLPAGGFLGETQRPGRGGVLSGALAPK